jgi:FkbM family methyltransferase
LPLIEYFQPFYFRFRTPKAESAAYKFYPRYITSEDVVVEVGARVGGASHVLTKLAKKVYSFEPNPYAYNLLKIGTSRLKNLETYNMALGTSEGKAILYINGSFKASPMASIATRNRRSKTVEVEVATLDAMRFGEQPTSLVVDCEGSELDVLQGGQQTIHNLNSLLIETHKIGKGVSNLEKVRDYVVRLKRFSDVRVETDDEGADWVLASRKP